jgi:hypothetical protein
MTTTRILFASIFLTSLALTAPAQAQPAAGASAPAATMAHDCAKPMAKHDHGAEKGNPMPASKSDGCSPAKASSTMTAASAAEKNKLKHDHAKDGK